MAKKKIKLTQEQKVWHENLEWYLKNKVVWSGDQNLKEAVLDGKYAVLYGEELCYNAIVCVNTKEDVELQLKWNPFIVAHVIELDHLDLVKEVVKSRGPDWSVWKEKNEKI